MTHDLAGRTIVLTGERKADEFRAPLERRGARVIVAPALAYVDFVGDAHLQTQLRDVAANGVDLTVLTTGVGWNAVLKAAVVAGVATEFTDATRSGTVIARGAKSRGAAIGSGLSVSFIAASETSAELIEHLATVDLAGKRVLVQHHGSGSDDIDHALEALGAHVISAVVYRTTVPADFQPLDAAIDLIAHGQADAVAFTSAPLVVAFFARARTLGREADVLAALRDSTVAAAIGDVTAPELTGRGITPFVPSRPRLGALVKELAAHLAQPTEPAHD